MLEVQGLDGSNLERVYLLERASTGQHQVLLGNYHSDLIALSICALLKFLDPRFESRLG